MPESIPTSFVFAVLVVIGMLFLSIRAWPWVHHRLFTKPYSVEFHLLTTIASDLHLIQMAMKEPCIALPESVTVLDEISRRVLEVVATMKERGKTVEDHGKEIENRDVALSIEAILKTIAGNSEYLCKGYDKTAAALDALNLTASQLLKVQKQFLGAIYGQDGSGYSDLSDEEQEIRENAEVYRKRYGCSWTEAMSRARNAAAVQTGPGMGAGV